MSELLQTNDSPKDFPVTQDELKRCYVAMQILMWFGVNPVTLSLLSSPDEVAEEMTFFSEQSIINTARLLFDRTGNERLKEYLEMLP